jgi:hypothetical protein
VIPPRQQSPDHTFRIGAGTLRCANQNRGKWNCHSLAWNYDCVDICRCRSRRARDIEVSTALPTEHIRAQQQESATSNGEWQRVPVHPRLTSVLNNFGNGPTYSTTLSPCHPSKSLGGTMKGHRTGWALVCCWTKGIHVSTACHTKGPLHRKGYVRPVCLWLRRANVAHKVCPSITLAVMSSGNYIKFPRTLTKASRKPSPRT